jgi:rRNA processing protein Gar1
LGYVLNLDQTLLLENNEILGSVEDVFGRVEVPLYSVFLNIEFMINK